MLKINYLVTDFMEINTLFLHKINLLFDLSISVALLISIQSKNN